MKTLRLGIMGFALTALMALTSCHSKSKTQSLPASVISRSHLGDGDYTPLQRVLAKARRGESITIGFIGGSITRGEGATSSDRQYADLVTHWWVDQFPKSKITLVNAGVAGTNSNYGCLRVQRDLISKHPDFVVVEFGVNDKDDLAHAETYEGVVRQLMMDPDHPAVVLLFLMHHDGTNAQDLQAEVGRQYHLPMISYRDAMWPEIEAGRLKFSDITADAIHPNDRGHAAIAAFIDSLLQDVLDHLPANGAIASVSRTLPPPRFTDLFANARIVNAVDLKPVICHGWSYDEDGECWRSNVPGSVVDFDVHGQAIDLLYDKMDGGYGTAQVSVDGGEAMKFDSWLNGSWGPLYQVDRIARSGKPVLHHVRIELLEEKNPLSTGHEFRIRGFGVAWGLSK